MNRTLTGAAAVAALFLATGAAQAQNLLTVDGDTTGAPAASFGPYNAVPFSVSQDGNVRVETIVGFTNFDTVVHLYASTFDPTNVGLNQIAVNDDGGAGPCGSFSCSLINQSLAPGQYVAVVRGFGGAVGVYRLEVEGPVFIGLVGGAGDAGIMGAESASAMLQAQTQSLRQIVRANSGARQQVAAGDKPVVSSMNGFSTAGFSVWAEIAGGQINADFGGDLDITNFLGQAGVEMALEGPFVFGVGLGGGTTSADATGLSLDGDAYFVQPYVAYIQGPLTAVASFVYTHTDYDDSTDTIESGDRFGGSLTAGYDVPVMADTVATPFGYLAGGWERFDTSAGNENSEYLIGRAGVELSHQLILVSTGTLTAFSSLAAEYVSLNEPELGPALLLNDYDDDRFGGRVEVGFDFTIAGTNTQLFASGYGGGLGTDAPGFGGRLGLKMPF